MTNEAAFNAWVHKYAHMFSADTVHNFGHSESYSMWLAATEQPAGEAWEPAKKEDWHEAFNDFYAGVADEIDKRSAMWGFECGMLEGEMAAMKESPAQPEPDEAESNAAFAEFCQETEMTPNDFALRIWQACNAWRNRRGK